MNSFGFQAEKYNLIYLLPVNLSSGDVDLAGWAARRSSPLGSPHFCTAGFALTPHFPAFDIDIDVTEVSHGSPPPDCPIHPGHVQLLFQGLFSQSKDKLAKHSHTAPTQASCRLPGLYLLLQTTEQRTVCL